MGQRISFYKNDYNKDLKEILVEHFDDFKNWYLKTEVESLEEFGEQFGNKALKNYLRQDADFRYDFIYLDQPLIDELTSEFIAEYFDATFRDNNFLDFFGPTMSTWRYEESSKLVEETKDEEFLKLWNYLIKGRSLIDNKPFHGFSNEIKIGFLNQNELKLLKERIEFHFESHDFLQEKYGTEVDENTTPKTAGLEYVLEAISYLTSDNVVLISEIEQESTDN